MECVEAASALKNSITKEMAPQALFFDDIMCWEGLNAQNGVGASEDFSVDDLLDFSNEDGFAETEPDNEADNDKVKGFDPENSALSEKNEPGLEQPEPEPTSELSVPDDDLENLEWLSHFVEDSFSEFTTSLPARFVLEKPNSETRPDPEDGQPEKPFFKSPVLAKARSKRTRTGGRVRLLGSPSLTESSSSSSSSSSPSSPWLICSNALPKHEPAEPVGSVEKPPKKQKRRLMDGSASQPPRRCSHCGVQKTPQWRTGPNGAKTLCNACGVRFKSGRLLPEYRPACSPTFSSELHSNHHRKVLEMRREKEGTEQPVVPSFG